MHPHNNLNHQDRTSAYGAQEFQFKIAPKKQMHGIGLPLIVLCVLIFVVHLKPVFFCNAKHYIVELNGHESICHMPSPCIISHP
jgi:hypothetical protein